MKINYRILSCSKENHTMLVRYWTDVLTEDDLTSFYDEYGKIVYDAKGHPVQCRTDVNISFYDNSCPCDDDIMELIERNVPYLWLYNMHEVKSGNTAFNICNVETLVGSSGSFEKKHHVNLESYLASLIPDPEETGGDQTPK